MYFSVICFVLAAIGAWMLARHHNHERARYTPEHERDLAYYATINKVFYEINPEQARAVPLFVANKRYPCIFVESLLGGRMNILQFQNDIEHDSTVYTAFRSFVGKQLNVYCDVLIIVDAESSVHRRLVTLDGDEVPFSSLGRSQYTVKREWIAPMAVK